MMPNMNGFESLTTIRNLAPSMKNTKIIMFSNLSSQGDIDKAMSN
jgi:CheY-like chemotaxis protein